MERRFSEDLSRIGILSNPNNSTHVSLLHTARAASQSAGLMMVGVEARNPEELDHAFVILRAESASGLIILADALLYAQQFRIAPLCARIMLPSVSHQREFVEAGGLLSYGEPLRDYFRRAATSPPRVCLAGRPERREYSRQFGSHPGNPGENRTVRATYGDVDSSGSHR